MTHFSWMKSVQTEEIEQERLSESRMMKYSIVISLVFLFSCSSIFASSGYFGGGTGSEANPFVIEDAADLFAVNLHTSAAYILAVDIDLAGFNFAAAPILQLWHGHFNGNGHVVRNLKINGDADLGLFGRLCFSTVTDLGVVDARITGRSYVGILTGSVWDCHVSRCYSTGTVDGTVFAPGEDNICAGGLIGIIDRDAWRKSAHTFIEKCYSSANVTGGSWVGGITGYVSENGIFSTVTFRNCYSTGSVSGQDDSLGGGFIGEALHKCEFYNCYSTGDVSSSNTTYGGFAGRIVAPLWQDVSNCFWNTETSGTTIGCSIDGLPGLVGINNAQMGQQSTYSFGDWDFVNDWQMDGYYGRPLLKDNSEPPYYNVSVSMGEHGAVSHAGINWYKKGEPLLVTAIPDPGWVVDKWYVGSTGAQSDGLTYNVGPVLADMEISVTFKPAVLYCSVTISHGADGSVSPIGIVRIERGDELTIAAYPDHRYEVDQWKLNGSVYQYGSNTFTLYGTQTNTGSVAVNVSFKPIMYTVHIISGVPVGNGDVRIGDHGSTAPNGYQQVQQGGDLTITAYPDTGYEVEAWQVNGVLCNQGETTYDLQDVPGNMTIGVLFKNTVFAGGMGTALSPYQVHDFATLSAVNDDPAAHYMMTNDIDLSGEPDYEDAVIGKVPNAPFLGVFDGNHKTITGLVINSHNDYLGLFGVISSANGLQGQVRNLILEGAILRSGSSNVGALCGLNQSGLIERCRVTGVDISGDQRVAGLCGYNTGTIRFSSAEGSVTGSYRVGLLTGNCYQGTIGDCYAIGTIFMEGQAESGGGISGDSNQAAISNTYASCTFSGAGQKLGSFCGWSQNSTYDGCVTNRNTFEAAVGGTGGGDVGTIAGRGQSQMQTMESWAATEWDFLGSAADGTDDIWRMCQDGVDFPRLWWQFTPGDIACGDGVNLMDFAVLAQNWIKDEFESGFYDNADINGDGVIETQDLVIFTEHWLD